MRDSTDIANAIEQVNEIVATQNAALQSVKTALEGKAAGGGTDISLGVTGASVGDIVKVKAVDENGKPTEWEAIQDEYELIADVTLQESVKTFTQTFSQNYKSLAVIVNTKKYTGDALENYGAFWRLFNGSGQNKINYLLGDFISYSTDTVNYFKAACHNDSLFEMAHCKASDNGVNPTYVALNNVAIRGGPGLAKVDDFTEISKIEISGYQTPFSANSRIVIWGVRA